MAMRNLLLFDVIRDYFRECYALMDSVCISVLFLVVAVWLVEMA